MKRIFILLIVLLSISGAYAQNYFTLSLEFVKPSGKIDGKAYFLAKLKNHNDSLSFFVDYGGNKYSSSFHHSFLIIIYGEIGNKEDISGNRAPFFDYGDNKVFLIKPSEEIRIKLPLFSDINTEGNGILPLSVEALRKIKKVRIKLEKFESGGAVIGGSYKSIQPKKTIDLYSNWVNVDGKEAADYYSSDEN